MIRTLMIAALAALVACAPPAPPKPPQAPDGSAVVELPPMKNDPDLDLLMINTGRMGMFLDRAGMAIDFEAPFVSIPEMPGLEPNSEQAIWRNLRAYGRDAVFYQQIYCSRGLIKGAPCQAKPPEFISQEDSPPPDKAALEKHLAELDAYFEPTLGEACKIGKAKTKDDMFCSVE